jgi:membrane associated rhomboid family serine protease
MFPISDDNPRRHLTPFVNYSVIAACVLVFLWQASLGDEREIIAVYQLGMIPARLLGGEELPPDIVLVPAWATVFTSMFMHGGWLHLGGNMLYLWIFGDNIEDSMGHGRYLVFYLLCGAAAALTQGLINPVSTIPMVGASGAISGVLGAYMLLHPGATVRVLVFLGFFVTVVHIPALIVLGVWFALQLFSGLAAPVDQPGVAFWAHVGGFVAGLVLVGFFKRRDVPMLERPHHRAFEVERRRGPWGGPRR